jgi:hypothetical protein
MVGHGRGPRWFRLDDDPRHSIRLRTLRQNNNFVHNNCHIGSHNSS